MRRRRRISLFLALVAASLLVQPWAALFPAQLGTRPEVWDVSRIANEQASKLLRATPSLDSARTRVDLADGTVMLGNAVVDFGDGSAVDWSDDHDGGRSLLRLLHALMPVRDLAVLATAGDQRAADVALAMVRSWRDVNPRSAPADAMAWHDETTAQRLLSLVELDAAVRAVEVPNDQLEVLGALAAEHVVTLLDPEFHATGTNHGMFQDHAILAWASSQAALGRPEAEAATTTATARLVAYLTGSISSDGVHLEHAPAYHQLIAENLDLYVKFFELIGDAHSAHKLSVTRERMMLYAIHVIQPDGTLPLVADTFTSDLPSTDLFDDPAYRYAATSGADGVAAEATDAFFPEAGYAIMRDTWQAGGAGTYLHFGAAFHGTYHKHADDLSLWLYHDGPLLTESGPNGYDYDDPFTVYAFGASSHNVVLVDGVGVPRTDGSADSVRLIETSRSGDVSAASGITDRLPAASHTRSIRYDRSTRLVSVVDDLRSNGPHTYSLLWHTAPGITSVERDGGVELLRNGTPVASLRVAADAPVRMDSITGATGSDGTVVGGWRLGGGGPEPVETLRFDVTSASDGMTLTTTIALYEAAP